ncbi:MAG: flagellar basal body protein FliL [Gammaproteobacteria bacterium HGW-Gammaproteobacteria-3]|jgi:flagellar FliL protein|nr:MAG: flagellar basal body protein FliL [Gammaproteobacteria bacterium HGW-Gammaproteobacteria-3]
MAEKKQQEIVAKKSGKMLWIIIAVIVVLIGVGAGYFFMAKSSDDNETTEEQTQEQAPPAETFYFAINKPLIVNFSRSSALRLIQVSVAFLVEDANTLEDLKKHEPMIRNNLLMLITAADPEALLTPEGKDKLKTDIYHEVVAVLEKMTGKKTVKEVFFTDFVMQ